LKGTYSEEKRRDDKFITHETLSNYYGWLLNKVVGDSIFKRKKK